MIQHLPLVLLQIRRIKLSKTHIGKVKDSFVSLVIGLMTKITINLMPFGPLLLGLINGKLRQLLAKIS